MRISEILEAFDTAPELNWDGGHATKYSHGAFNTRFTVAGQVYLIDIAQDVEPEFFTTDVWVVSFSQSSTAGYRPTGNMGENASAVLGGVVSAVKNFIAEHNPVALGFSGKQKDRLGRLYIALVKHLVRDIAGMGFRIHTASKDGVGGMSEVILLHRSDEPKDFLIGE